MNRYVLQASMMIVVDSDSEADMLEENFYARLSELVQSEDHMLEADIAVFQLPAQN